MQFHRYKSYLFAIFAISCLLSACTPPDHTEWNDETDERLRVVATFSIPSDFANEVAGDRILLHTLVPRESDPHTFDPNPSDTRRLARADLILEIGHDFEPWLNRLYRSSRSSARRGVLTEGIELLPVDEASVHSRFLHEHKSAEMDPHVWHDVRHAKAMVRSIRDLLVELDPGNAEHYTENAARYLAELSDLDAWIIARTESLSAVERKLFTHHDVFQYFAGRYGFEVIGNALTAATTEVFDPSASQVGYQIQTLRAEGVPIVFPEYGGDSRLITRIANEAGARIGPPLYTGSLSKSDGDAPTYVEMMRYNVDTLVRHLTAGNEG